MSKLKQILMFLIKFNEKNHENQIYQIEDCRMSRALSSSAFVDECRCKFQYLLHLPLKSD